MFHVHRVRVAHQLRELRVPGKSGEVCLTDTQHKVRRATLVNASKAAEVVRSSQALPLARLRCLRMQQLNKEMVDAIR